MIHRIGTLNVRGQGTDDDLNALRCSSQLDVLVVTETWQRKDSLLSHHDHDISASALFPPWPPGKGGFGGVRILSSPSCRIQYRAHLRSEKAQVLIVTTSCGISIAGVYVPPMHGKHNMQFVLHWIQQHLHGPAIIVGDLNARSVRWDRSTNAYGSALVTWADEHDFKINAPPSPTFSSSQGCSVIDLFAARGVRLSETRTHPEDWIFGTDHELVCTTVRPEQGNFQCRIPLWAQQDTNRISNAQQFYEEELNDIALRADEVQNATELDSLVAEWQATMLKPWEESCRTRPRRWKPGWTSVLDRMAKEHARLSKKAKRGDTAAALTAKVLDREIKHTFRRNQRNLERRVARESEKIADDQALLHKTVKTVLEDGSIQRRPCPIAYMDHLISSLPVSEPLEVAKFSVPDNFVEALTTAAERIRPGKAAGPDGIPPSLIRMSPVHVATSVAALWRAVGRLGHLPVAFSVGRITPVYKKRGQPELLKSYRPITILNVLRRLLSTATDILLRKCIVFHPRQWGFQKSLGTVHAITHMDNRRRNQNQETVVLDMHSAYDVAPRKLIVHELRRRGVDSTLVNMVQTLLGPSSVYVTGAPEKQALLTSGVPQGDPSSPTLFNVLMDTFLNEVDAKLGAEKQLASCFADDVLLTSSSRSLVQEVLEVCSDWTQSTGMKWNVSKCQELVPNASSGSRSREPLLLSGLPIAQATEVTYLDVTLRYDGVSDDATLKRIEKAEKVLAQLRKSTILDSLPFAAKRNIIQTYVLSVADYATEVTPHTAAIAIAASNLDRKACEWVTRTRVVYHNLVIGRALCRLLPLIARKRLKVIKLADRCQLKILTAEPHSAEKYHAQTVLSHEMFKTATKTMRHSRKSCSEVFDEIKLTEWHRARRGIRKVPQGQKIPQAYQVTPPHVHHAISRFYLNTIPLPAWNLCSRSEKQHIRDLLNHDKLKPHEAKKLTILLETLVELLAIHEQTEPSTTRTTKLS